MAKPRYVYEFGTFRLDPAERLLMRGAQAITLTPKALDTLIVLVEQGQHIVSSAQLLSQHISTLRKVLGEMPGGGPYIETVPRHGYRLLVPVHKLKLPGKANLSALSTQHSKKAERFPAPVSAPNSANTVLVGSGDHNKLGAIRPGMRQGRYEILALLGVGGMGSVYLAHDTQLDRKVALKMLSEKYTENVEWLRRFVREAKVISALNHPNIITIHEVGEVRGSHYIATEYIEGRTLRMQMLAERMPIPEVLNLATQVAGALSAAHAAGIVHRDIKPENVMLRPDGYVKLLDFGLAKPLAANTASASQMHTDPGTIMGTVNYMSPEQARGLPVDARSDVFSLGVLVYEMLAGRAPFKGGTTSDVIVAILERQPPPLSQVVRGLPSELERIVGKALRKDRELRYQTIKDLYLDLKSLQQDLELRSRFGDSYPDDHPPRREESAKSSGFGARTQASAVQKFSRLESAGELAIPEVRYARSSEVNIAYQVVGDAPLDLVFVMGWISHLEYFWSEPSFARFLRRLARFARVILFDKRGTGLSDRVPLEQLPTLEQRMDDVRAVMEAVGSQRAVLCGVSEGGPMCSLFAASHPEKTIALVMIGSYARRLQGEGYPWGPSKADRDLFLEEIREHWGGPVGLEDRAPSVANDPAFRAWWAAYLRHGASPSAAVALTRMNTEIDIRHVLPSIRVPTLVVHRTGDLCLKVQEGRYLAEHIPGAKFVELPGIDHLPFVGAQEEILDEIEEFLTGVRHASICDRVLATVLVARLVSGHLAGSESFFRKEAELFKGRVLEADGDQQMLASFDGPARAIRAACAIRAYAQRLKLELQTGLHTGECDVQGEWMGGPAVEIAKQVAAQSALAEILVSSTVKDLVAGSGIAFAERGTHSLPEELGEWRLYAVTRCG